MSYGDNRRVDEESTLADDMKRLKDTENMDHLLLHAVFDDKFPYSPPFVRLVKPVIKGGYVLAGGAICMELLTPQVRESERERQREREKQRQKEK